MFTVLKYDYKNLFVVECVNLFADSAPNTPFNAFVFPIDPFDPEPKTSLSRSNGNLLISFSSYFLFLKYSFAC